MMALQITPLTVHIGAEISGVQLDQELSETVIEWLQEALVQYQVLFFKNQPITPQQQYTLAKRFGPLHIHPIYPKVQDRPEIIILDTELNDLRDNALWHTDVTFAPQPPLGAILAAKKIPSVGGDTLWSSATAAYEGLSPAFKRLLGGLNATHDIVKSFPVERFAISPEEKERFDLAIKKNPPITHPVIRTHPVSGKQGLFVNEGFTTRINELNAEESAYVLKYLFEHIQKPEYTVRWRWQKDDIAFWDNRATFHYAVDDYRPAHRIMNRATIMGDTPFYDPTVRAKDEGARIK